MWNGKSTSCIYKVYRIHPIDIVERSDPASALESIPSQTTQAFHIVFSEIVHLVNQPHHELHCRKCSRAHGHRPQQRRSDTLEETTHTSLLERLREAIPHRLVPLLLAETVGLHLTLDDVEGITRQPERFTGKTTVHGNLPSRNVLPVDLVARSIRVHHPLKRREP